MPGKVNPVIPEYVISIAHRIYGNDQLITHLAAQGCLELNAYIPVIGHAMIESIRLLISANEVSARHLLKGIEIDPKLTEEKMLASPAVTTALLPFIGYNRAAEMAECMKEYGLSVYEANRKLGFMKEEKLKEILKPENLVQGGYRLKDLEE